MSSLGSPSPFLFGKKTSLSVERSLRFNRDDNAYLTRTPSSAGNRKTWTYSAWVKLGQTGINSSTDPGNGIFLSCGAGSNAANMALRITNNGYIGIDYYGVGGYYSTGRLRDPSAWYHCVWVMDTTESTAANRMKVYVNGTLFYNNSMSLSQNADTPINNNSATTIGVYPYNTSHAYRLDGYLAEVNFIDGYAYDPSYFAETDAVTGQWNPKTYTGSYGTNGFYLNFSDNSGTTATTLGKDSSGNSNNFTPNNFSVSAGAGNDSLEDTPTNNFCTLNPLDKMGTVTVTEGNLKAVITGNDASLVTGSFGVSSGKWYYEALVDTAGAGFVGWIRKDVSSYSGYSFQQSGSLIYFAQNGALYKDGAGGQTYGTSYGNGDLIGCAINLDDNQVTFYKNNSSQGTVSITAGTYNPNTATGGSSATFTLNFGQRAFSYTPPTGFKALNSANLPDPTILLPNKHFDTTLYTGTNSTQEISTFNFQPDWLWFKNRGGTNWHALFDSVRGKQFGVTTNNANVETTDNGSQDVTSFDDDGFTLGSAWYGSVNASGANIVAWGWDAGETDSKTYTVTVVNDGGNKFRFDGFGTSSVTLSLAKGGTYTFNYPSGHPLRFSTTSDGTHGGGSEYTSGVTTYGNSITITVAANAPTLYYYCSNHSGMGGQVNPTTTLGSSNFDGTIQSVVKASPTAGFSIIKYTGNGSDGATVGHGLGVKPDFILIKKRDNNSGGNTGNWIGQHKSLTNGVNATSALFTLTSYTNAAIYLNATNAESSYVFDNQVNGNTDTFVAYCFNEVAGYSKFGKYTGNSSSDGTFVFTGFRPAWLMIKRITGSDNWMIHDNKRDPYNLVRKFLLPDSANAETADDSCDFLSNGFKWRINSGLRNSSGETYIYLAFAESPFRYARAR